MRPLKHIRGRVVLSILLYIVFTIYVIIHAVNTQEIKDVAHKELYADTQLNINGSSELIIVGEYKSWQVDKLGNIIRYTTHGNIVHGHRFGWFKKPNNCNIDTLYLSYSSSHKNKNLLDKLKNRRILLKTIFPEAEDKIFYMEPTIIGTNKLGSMKIVTFTNFPQIPLLNTYMKKLDRIEISIEKPFDSLFDIKSDEWSLQGYIAAKLKAKEICERMNVNQNTLVAINN
ncbi:hypothetical protein OAL85_03605 [Methylophilaceae bacterium]|nr:hypothetical protein [Methylophilaceae bacterium]